MYIIGILLLLIGVAVVIEWMRELRTFQMTHYTIESPKLEGVQPKKMILLSDLHNYTYGLQNETLLAAIRKEKPDVILISGDMVIGKPGVDTTIASQFVSELTKVCDVYYANGNHEQRMKEKTDIYGDTYEWYCQELKEQGVHYLENTSECMHLGHVDARIYGLEIPNSAYQKFRKVTLPWNCLDDLLGKPNPEEYNILIAHNPVFISDYKRWGADLIVSGHLHGGVARIPGFRGVITPQGGLFPKYSGELTREGDTSIVVSKGIGIHTIKIRFLNPAEVVVLHIGKTEV